MDNVPNIIVKLGHQSVSIRTRALKNLLSKLSTGIASVDLLCQEDALGRVLLEWFNHEECPLQVEVLELLFKLAQHPSGAERLVEIGAVAFLQYMRVEALEYLHLPIDRVLSILLQIPRCSRPLRSTTSTQATRTQSHKAASGSRPGARVQDPPVASGSGPGARVLGPPAVCTSPQSVLLENGRGMDFPLLELSPGDNEHLREVALRLAQKEASIVASMLQHLETKVLHDFPPEVLLQRPEILRNMLSLVRTTEPDSGLDLMTLHCLATWMGKLKNSFQLHQHFCYSSCMYEATVIGDVAADAQQQARSMVLLQSYPRCFAAKVGSTFEQAMPVSAACHAILGGTLPLLQQTGRPRLRAMESELVALTLSVYKRALLFEDAEDLAEEARQFKGHVDTLATAVTALGPWRDDNDAFGAAALFGRLLSTWHHRFAVQLVSPTSKDLLCDLASNGYCITMHPTLHARLLKIVEVVDASCHADILRADGVWESIRAAECSRFNKAESVEHALDLLASIKSSLEGIQYHYNEDVLKALVGVCSLPTSGDTHTCARLNAEAISALLCTLSCPCDTVRLRMYDILLDKLCTENAEVLRRYLLQGDVLYHIAAHGLADDNDEICARALEVIFSLSSGNTDELYDFVPLLQVYIASGTGSCVSRASRLSSLLTTLEEGLEDLYRTAVLVRFLFHRDAWVRTWASKRILDALKQSNTGLPNDAYSSGEVRARVEDDPLGSSLGADVEAATWTQLPGASGVGARFREREQNARALLTFLHSPNIDSQLRKTTLEQLCTTLENEPLLARALASSAVDVIVDELRGPSIAVATQTASPALSLLGRLSDAAPRGLIDAEVGSDVWRQKASCIMEVILPYLYLPQPPLRVICAKIVGAIVFADPLVRVHSRRLPDCVVRECVRWIAPPPFVPAGSGVHHDDLARSVSLPQSYASFFTFPFPVGIFEWRSPHFDAVYPRGSRVASILRVRMEIVQGGREQPALEIATEAVQRDFGTGEQPTNTPRTCLAVVRAHEFYSRASVVAVAEHARQASSHTSMLESIEDLSNTIAKHRYCAVEQTSLETIDWMGIFGRFIRTAPKCAEDQTVLLAVLHLLEDLVLHGDVSAASLKTLLAMATMLPGLWDHPTAMCALQEAAAAIFFAIVSHVLRETFANEHTDIVHSVVDLRRDGWLCRAVLALQQPRLSAPARVHILAVIAKCTTWKRFEVDSGDAVFIEALAVYLREARLVVEASATGPADFRSKGPVRLLAISWSRVAEHASLTLIAKHVEGCVQLSKDREGIIRASAWHVMASVCSTREGFTNTLKILPTCLSLAFDVVLCREECYAVRWEALTLLDNVVRLAAFNDVGASASVALLTPQGMIDHLYRQRFFEELPALLQEEMAPPPFMARLTGVLQHVSLLAPNDVQGLLFQADLWAVLIRLLRPPSSASLADITDESILATADPVSVAHSALLSTFATLAPDVSLAHVDIAAIDVGVMPGTWVTEARITWLRMFAQDIQATQANVLALIEQSITVKPDLRSYFPYFTDLTVLLFTTILNFDLERIDSGCFILWRAAISCLDTLAFRSPDLCRRLWSGTSRDIGAAHGAHGVPLEDSAGLPPASTAHLPRALSLSADPRVPVDLRLCTCTLLCHLLSDLDPAVDAPLVSTALDAPTDDDDLCYGQQVCASLVDLYDVLCRNEHALYELELADLRASRHLAGNALAILVAWSLSAKQHFVDAGEYQQLLGRTHDLLMLLDAPEGPGGAEAQAARHDVLKADLLLSLKLLRGFPHNGTSAMKTMMSASPLLNMIVSMKKVIFGDNDILSEVLAVVANMVAGCPEAKKAVVCSRPGRNVCVGSLVIKVAFSCTSQASFDSPLDDAHVDICKQAFAVLSSLGTCEESCAFVLRHGAPCRFIESACVLVLLPPPQPRRRGSRDMDVQLSVLRFLGNVSFSQTGQAAILHVRSAVDAVVDLANGSLPFTDTKQKHINTEGADSVLSACFLILRNLAFLKEGKPYFTTKQNPDPLDCLISGLRRGSLVVQCRAASALWALVYNSLKTQAVVRRRYLRDILQVERLLFDRYNACLGCKATEDGIQTSMASSARPRDWHLAAGLLDRRGVPPTLNSAAVLPSEAGPMDRHLSSTLNSLAVVIHLIGGNTSDP